MKICRCSLLRTLNRVESQNPNNNLHWASKLTWLGHLCFLAASKDQIPKKEADNRAQYIAILVVSIGICIFGILAFVAFKMYRTLSSENIESPEKPSGSSGPRKS